MKHEDLPQRWKDRILRYLRSKGETSTDRLSAGEFSTDVAKIQFEDGSSAEFRFSVVIEASEFGEVGVFTEHCGYHIFNLAAVTVTVDKEAH